MYAKDKIESALASINENYVIDKCIDLLSLDGLDNDTIISIIDNCIKNCENRISDLRFNIIGMYSTMSTFKEVLSNSDNHSSEEIERAITTSQNMIKDMDYLKNAIGELNTGISICNKIKEKYC